MLASLPDTKFVSLANNIIVKVYNNTDSHPYGINTITLFCPINFHIFSLQCEPMLIARQRKSNCN